MRLPGVGALVSLVIVAACQGPPPSPRVEGTPASEGPPRPAGRLAFMWKWGLYTARADGSDRTLVTRVPGAYAGPRWSAEARAFVIRAERPTASGPAGYVMFVSADGSEIVNLSKRTGSRYDAMVDWAPDGRRIVFVSRRPRDEYGQLYVMDRGATEVRRITDLPFEAQYPAWSPDGRSIAFAGVNGDLGGNFDLFVVGAGDGHVTRLTRDPAADNWPTWSPDGRQIAFFSDRDDDGIWVMDADGRNQRSLDTPGGEPSWSPDGRWIAFNCPTRPAICSVRPDGSDFTELFGRASFPAWIN